MLGAKNLLAIENGLQFKIQGSPLKVTHIRVELAADDTYTVVFLKARGLNVAESARVVGAYAEDLGGIIREHTALETRAPRVVGINA